MKKISDRFLTALLIAMLAASNFLGAAAAASTSPAQAAESIRASLVKAQLSLATDSSAATALVREAESTYQTELSDQITSSAPDAHERILVAFKDLSKSAARGDVISFAAARAQAWTGI